jgi:hypothetical protein
MSVEDAQLPKSNNALPLQRIQRLFPSNSSYANVVEDLISHEYTLNISDKRALAAYGQEMGRRYLYGTVAGLCVFVGPLCCFTQVYHQGLLLLPCLSS